MKLLIVGSDKVYAIENYYVKYLSEAGVDVELFTAQSLFYDYYQKHIFNKLLFKLGFSGIIDEINLKLLERISVFKPEVVWVFKGMEIKPSSLSEIKRRGIKLVNYNPDNPFIFTGKGSGNQFITDSIGLYDLHFTYNLEIQKQLEEQFNVETDILPFGFDLAESLIEKCKLETEIRKTCFLGNPDDQRAAFLNSIAEEGVEIDVYGNNWKNFVRHKNVSVKGPVYGDDLWAVLRKYRIQLNLMRIHNEDSHNMRSFEVPGIGGIMLAPDTKEHRMFFNIEKEIFLYSDKKECIRQIKKILEMSDEAAAFVRKNARQRSLQDGYDYRSRANFALGRIMRLHA